METSNAVQDQPQTGEFYASSDVARRMGIARKLASEERNMDMGLPEWARRSNPIIRRQLGVHWRVFLPQIGPIVKWLVPQIVIVLLTLRFEFVFALLMLLALSTSFLMPYGFYLYAKSLRHVIHDSVHSMTQEFRNNSFDLLRLTPFSLFEIVLSKMASAVWRRMDTLDTILAIALFTTLPVVTFMQVVTWDPGQYPGYSQLMIVLGLLTSLVRLPLELLMVSALGVLSGTTIRWRSPAVTSTLVLVFFYYVLLNMPRLLELSLPMQIVIEVVLPVLLPVIITTGAILGAVYFIEKRG